jgi:carbonic anhydrase/acetyltransferase-like protein (isoleucine patch superfamily)
METVQDIKTNELILNAEPEFVEGFSEKVPAQYFVLCEDSDGEELDKNIYEYDILGVSVLDWVQRACALKPIVLRVSEDDDVISLIRPYLSNVEFSVVLYANTPLISKAHIADLLGYVERKHMNVCKLKKGYVFRNEFIERADEFFSIDTYNFASNDFFEVKNLKDLDVAKKELRERMMKFYFKSGVVFENSNQVIISATTQIGSSKIESFVSVLGNSKIGTNCIIGANSVIKNSKIGDDVVVGENVIIDGSIVKDGAKIGSASVLKGSVVGENAELGAGVKISRSKIDADAVVDDFACVVQSKIEEEAKVQSCATLIKCNISNKSEVNSKQSAATNADEEEV